MPRLTKAVPKRVTVVPAKYAGVCSGCKGHFAIGTRIVWVGRGTCYHTSSECVPPNVREALGWDRPEGSEGGGRGEDKRQGAEQEQSEQSEQEQGEGQEGQEPKSEDPIEQEIRDLIEKAAELKRGKRPEQKPIEGEHEKYPLLLRLLTIGSCVWLSGPAGSGKTTAAEHAAKALGLELFICPPVSDPVELLGYRDAAGHYQDTVLYRWAVCDRPALLVLDEIDRSGARAVLCINAALANGWAVFPVGQLKIPATHKVVATANTWGTGASAEYVGSVRQDAALRDRFQYRVGWDYDLGLERKLAVQAGGKEHGSAAFAVTGKVRSNLDKNGIRLVWGPRSTMALAAALADGMDLGAALDVSALAELSADARAKAQSGVGL